MFQGRHTFFALNGFAGLFPPVNKGFEWGFDLKAPECQREPRIVVHDVGEKFLERPTLGFCGARDDQVLAIQAMLKFKMNQNR